MKIARSQNLSSGEGEKIGSGSQISTNRNQSCDPATRFVAPLFCRVERAVDGGDEHDEEAGEEDGEVEDGGPVGGGRCSCCAAVGLWLWCGLG